MEKNKERKKTKYLVILILIMLFFYDVYKFLNAEGNNHPVIEVLFNTIKVFASQKRNYGRKQRNYRTNLLRKLF